MTNTVLKAQIDSQITTKTLANSITPTILGANLKTVVDYVDQGVWIARISNTTVEVVLKDTLSFTAPVVANPFNGIVTITKTGFFTGKTVSKIEVEVQNYNDGTSLYICSAKQDDLNPNDTIKIILFPKDGAITGTPSFNGLLVKLKIYE